MMFRFLFLRRILLISAMALSIIVPAQAAFDNVWNFNGDLTAATGTGTMSFAGGADTVSSFTTPASAGIASLYDDDGSAGILSFSAYTAGQQLDIACGSGTVAEYTMVWDVLYPTASDESWRALYQTGSNTSDDADFFINKSNGIGVASVYHGEVPAETWSRIAVTIDPAAMMMRKYIDGVHVGSYRYKDSYIGRWDLVNGACSILGDNDGDTSAGYIASYRVTDHLMTSEEIHALGGVHAAGCATAGEVAPLPTMPEIDTIWSFNGNLNAESGTAVMSYAGTTEASTSFGTTVSFGLPAIDGDDGTAQVMSFPETTADQGYKVETGTNVTISEYTMVWDVLFPASSADQWRTFLQTSPTNGNDGELFANRDGAIGVSGDYDGTLLADTWHRVVMTNDADGTMVKYIDGVKVGEQYNRASRNEIDELFYILADNDGDTAAGYLANYRFMNRVMTEGEVAALGGVTATVPEPGTVVLLIIAIAGLVAIYRRK